MLERRPLDLYKLNKVVESLGGYEHLIKTKRWNKILKELNFKENTSARTLKLHFEKILYPFLLFEAGVTIPINNNNKKSSLNGSVMSESCDESFNTSASASPAKKKKGDTKRSNEDLKVESIQCLICEKGDDEGFILLCDGCDDSYHTYCLYPPLKEIPKGNFNYHLFIFSLFIFMF